MFVCSNNVVSENFPSWLGFQLAKLNIILPHCCVPYLYLTLFTEPSEYFSDAIGSAVDFPVGEAMCWGLAGRLSTRGLGLLFGAFEPQLLGLFHEQLHQRLALVWHAVVEHGLFECLL